MTGEYSEDQAGWRRTNPLGFVVQGLTGLRNMALPAVAIIVGSRQWDAGSIAVVPLLGAVLMFSLGASYLAWRKMRYRLGDNDVRVERGIISRTARSVPYERIQDVSLEQRLLPRLFGLVEVKFETGAGGNEELKLAYVSEAEGAALREAVRMRRDVTVPVHQEGEVGAEEEDRPLFVMSLPRLVTFGLFEFSLVVFAVVLGVAQQFDFLLPFDVWDSDRWMEALAGPGHWLASLGMATQVIGAVIGLLALSVLGFATGLTRTVLRDFGFRLEDTPRGLRRRRGLFTRTDVLMPVHRVQALKVTTGIVRRQFGWHGLEAVSLSQDAKSETHVIVPFAKIAEIAPVVAETGFALPDESMSWRRPSPRYHFDRGLAGAGFWLVLAAAVALFGQFAPFAVPFLEVADGVLVVLAGLAVIRQYFLWRHNCHAIDHSHVFVRRGWLAPKLDIASRVKVQSVEVVQGPIARWRGYADLNFGIAGGTLSLGGISVGEARALRDAVLESIASVDFSRLPR